MTAGEADSHAHDSFRCPAHVRGCRCPDLEGHLCNPYYVAGPCPDDLEIMPADAATAASTQAAR